MNPFATVHCSIRYFYLPKALMLLRFPRLFAQYYVENTMRHPTFQAIAQCKN